MSEWAVVKPIRSQFLSFACAGLLVAGCAGNQGARPSIRVGEATPVRSHSKRQILLEPIRLDAVNRQGSLEIVISDAMGHFERGGQLLAAKEYKQALEHYRKLLDQFPTSRLVSPTLYNAALAHEARGDYAKAAEHYVRLVKIEGYSAAGKDAAFRLGGCYAEIGQWASSTMVFERLLRAAMLSVADRTEAFARKGLGHFRLNEMAKAKQTFLAALRFHSTEPADRQLESDFFLGMIQYYLAAIPHREFREIKVDADAKSLAKTLDDKARLLLSAQAAYVNTIKVKDPYWAAAAGFQVGSLYREFYNALMTNVPSFRAQAKRNASQARITVEQAHAQLVKVYLEALHKRVRPLLNKAIGVFEKNLLMAERVGIQSNWVRKTRIQIHELKQLLTAAPEEAIRMLPKPDEFPEDERPTPKKGNAPAIRREKKLTDDPPSRVIL
jgi:tetratricopeptide (TPR) repeat protein